MADLIQNIAAPLLKDIISWTSTFIYILIIVKAGMLIANVGKGAKSTRRRGQVTENGEDRRLRSTKDKVKRRQEKMKNFLSKNGLSDKYGKVKFYIHDENHIPICGATVICWPLLKETLTKPLLLLKGNLTKRAWNKIFHSKLSRLIQDQETNLSKIDGSTNELELLAGNWQGFVSRLGFRVKNKNLVQNNDYIYNEGLSVMPFVVNEGGTTTVVNIDLERDNNSDFNFNPEILEVNYSKKHKKLELKAKVK